MADCVVIITSAPDRDSAERIADTLIEERLAACVHIREVTSRYRWKGKMERGNEHVLDIHAAAADAEAITARIAALHPYEMPGILTLPVIAGSADYLRWVATAGAWPE